MSYLRYQCLFGSSIPPVVCRRAHVLFTLSLPPVVCKRTHILFTLSLPPFVCRRTHILFTLSLPPVVCRRTHILFTLSLPQVVCRRAHISSTLLMFVCVQWCSPHIVLFFMFVFLRLVYPMLSVSLEFPFSIAPSVFSDVYLINRKCN